MTYHPSSDGLSGVHTYDLILVDDGPFDWLSVGRIFRDGHATVM